MTVLVSGFGPWGSFDENPTLAVLDGLAGVQGVVTLALPVDTTKLGDLVADALRRHRPALWLGLGLAYGSASVAVERIALNLRDFKEPDVVGTVAHGQVVAGGPAAYAATVPVEAIRDRLRAAGIPARLSETAGTFLCNQLFYTVLHAAAQGGETRVGFLHVPAHPALVARQAGRLAEAPSMGIDLSIGVATATLASRGQSRYMLA